MAKKVLVVIPLLVTLLWGCKGEPSSDDSKYADFINSVTGRIVLRDDPIFINFSREVHQAKSGDPAEGDLLKFTPPIKGSAYWQSPFTLQFIPEGELEQGKSYQAELQLDALFDATPKELSPFKFNFSVTEQAFDVKVAPLKVDETGLYTLVGSLQSLDRVSIEVLENIVTATIKKRSLPIVWQRGNNPFSYTFTINSIPREREASVLTIQWDGRSVKSKSRGSLTTPIPAKELFSIAGEALVDQKASLIELPFSDPLDPAQDLKGLITLDGRSDIQFTVLGNTLRIYPASLLPQMELTIAKGVKNHLGEELGKEWKSSVYTQLAPPSLKVSGKGAIIPDSGDSFIAIESVNLKKVIVEAYHIPENSIKQFFQWYNYTKDPSANHWRLREVASVAWREIVPLQWDSSMVNREVRTGLNLTPLKEKFPSGMFRIKVFFDRDMVVSQCEETLEPVLRRSDEASLADDNSWDNYFGPYSFEERDNPCSPTFYREYGYYNNHAGIRHYRNVLFSNLGITVKGDKANTFHTTVVKTPTASPLRQAKVELFSYQQKLLASGKTDSRGMVSFQLDESPYFAVASYKEERIIIRTDSSTALSTSHFETSGSSSTAPLQGYIYGDRDLWRPGDEIFLTLITKESEQPTDREHPAVIEFFTPKGQLHYKTISHSTVDSFYSFTLSTPEKAETGYWKAQVTLGGTHFTHPVRVETVRPNRIKIDITLDGDEETAVSPSQEAQIQANWLYGAPAGGLRSDMELQLQPTTTQFDQFKEYTFDDPAQKEITYSPQKVYEGSLNSVGASLFTLNLPKEGEIAGSLSATFTTRVFEPSGSFSRDRVTRLYQPYEEYLGIKGAEPDRVGRLETDQDHQFPIVLVNRDGELLKEKREIEISLYKLEWSWWWESGGQNLASYLEKEFYEPIETETVELSDGEGQYTLNIAYPEWGRYLIRATDRANQYSTGVTVYVDWPGYRERPQKGGSEGASMLSFSSDKESYRVGEEALISLPASERSRILIAVEREGQLIESQWIEPKRGTESALFTLPIREEMAPNIYIHASLIQPHDEKENDRPIRMYGIIPLMVFNRESQLTPVITAADEFRPETTETITISEKSGLAMGYTIAVVDEGLLSLTRFKTPSPWDYFYQKEPSQVAQWDMFDFISSSYTGLLNQLIAIGGGYEAEGDVAGLQKKLASGVAGDRVDRARRFQPFSQFYGPFKLQAGESRSHRVPIPSYIGKARIMVVAAKEEAFGSATKEITIKKPLMVITALPKKLSILETFDLPVSALSYDNRVTKARLWVETDEQFTLEDPTPRQVDFSDSSDVLVPFRLKVGESPGRGRITVKAEGGGYEAESLVEIDVRIPTPPISRVSHYEIAPGETIHESIELFGAAGTNSVALEVSAAPTINLEERVSTLISNPYNTLEQTVSAAFPQLYLPALTKLEGKESEKVQNSVRTALNKLNRQFLNSEGGFSYWPGGAVNFSSTNYAGHFLIEAQKRGYLIPAGVLERWIRYQARIANQWTPASGGGDEATQAYRLYTLALAGEASIGAMNQLREYKPESSIALWYLAGAYTLINQESAGEELLASAASATEKSHLSNPFYSAVRDKAVVANIMISTNRYEQLLPLIKEITEELKSDRWLSSRSTAYALTAVLRYIETYGSSDSLSFHYSRGGEEFNVSVEKPLYTNRSTTEREKETFTVTNPNDYTLFASFTATGQPLPGREEAFSSGDVSLTVQYFDGLGATPLALSSFVQGQDILIKVTVTNRGSRGAYTNMALSHLIPSGWELSPLDRGFLGEAPYTFRDIQDERVYTYFDIAAQSSVTYSYRVNAAFTGRFYSSPVSVEALYDKSVSASTEGRWIEVVKLR